MRRPDGRLLSVGDLGRRAGLSSKALRHYDRIGLFAPAFVDGANYRWYTLDQVGTARMIAELRAVDVPLHDVRTCLTADPASVELILTAHRVRLEARLTRVRGQLHSLNHLIGDALESSMSHTHSTTTTMDEVQERALSAALFNGVWELMEREDRSTDDDDRMLHMAHASRYHWGQVGAPQNLARGEWMCSRVYTVLRRPEPAMHHAQRVLELCERHGIADWDLGFAYEALARAAAVARDVDAAREYTAQALAAAENIAQDEDRELLLSDLETIPGQERFW